MRKIISEFSIALIITVLGGLIASTIAAGAQDSDKVLFGGLLYKSEETFSEMRPELRGVWLNVRSIPPNPEGIRTLVNRLDKANFNAILTEVFYLGQTIYPSEVLRSRGLEPQMSEFSGFDPLKELIVEAHKRSMEVHAWVDMFYVGLNSPGQVLAKYPDWQARNKDGTAGYRQGNNRFFWVCPMHPGVSEFYVELINEVVQNYQVDGIHLDYIRYPDPVVGDACYAHEHRNEFLKLYGIDPVELDPERNPDECRLWNKLRADSVTALVALLSQEIHRLRPEVAFTCAVWPRGMPIELNPGLLQDWPVWARNRYLDALIPMAYSSRANEMRGLLVWVKHFLQGNIPLYAGLQGFNLPGPEELVKQVLIARECGAEGVIVFAYPYLDDTCLEALRLGPFKVKVPAKSGGRSQGEGDISSPNAIMYFHENPRRIRAKYVATAPIIDGQFNDPAWLSADWQSSFELITGEGRAKVDTRIAACYDTKNLYVAFEAKDPFPEAIRASVTKRDGPVFYDDSVELFLDTKHNHSFYYHFAVNSLGTQYDSCSRKGPSWDGKWTVGVTKAENGWNVEIAIPFKEIAEAPPRPGEVWGINFNRTMLRLGEFSGWSYTPGTFHAPSFFGDIVFDPNR